MFALNTRWARLLLALVCGLASSAARAEYRDLNAIELQGLNAKAASQLRTELAEQVEIVEAMHPMISTQTFRFRVLDAIKRGLQSSGYLDGTVEPIPDAKAEDRFVLQIRLGQRFTWGQIHVHGSTPEINAKLVGYLKNIKPNPKKEQLLWRSGEFASGSVFSRLGLSTAIQKHLSLTGLDGRSASVDFQRDEDRQVVDLIVRLSKKDKLTLVQIPSNGNQADPKHAASSKRTTVSDKSPIAVELDAVFQRYFRETGARLEVRIADQKSIARFGFSKTENWAEVRHPETEKQLGAIRIRSSKDLLVSVGSPAKAWRFPVAKVGLQIVQKSLDEVEDENCTWFSFTFGTDAEEQKGKCGFRFSAKAWDDWFPPKTTKRFEVASNVHYQFGGNRLVVDDGGALVELKGTDGKGREIQITAPTVQELINTGDKIVDAAKADDILVRSKSGDVTDLVAIFAKDNDADTEQGITIPPANGQADVWAMLTLHFVEAETFFPKDSLASKLAVVYALDFSGRRKTIPGRLNELENEALAGPVFTAVLGDLAFRSKQLHRALHYFDTATQLCDSDGAMKGDLQRLLSRESLVGQCAESIDVRELLELYVELRELQQEENLVVRSILDAMPAGDTRQRRQQNVVFIANAIFDLKYKQRFLQFCEAKRSAVAQAQLRIAERQKKKEKKKK